MENNKAVKKDQSNVMEESFSIRNFLKACAAKWQWFAISIALFTCLGVLFVIRQEPKYVRTMSVLIKNQDEGSGASSIANSFSQLGLVSSNTNVYNELISLLSPAVMMEVVQELDLQTNYVKKGFPHGTTLYGGNLPFKVDFMDLPSTSVGSFKAHVNPDGSMTLDGFMKVFRGEKEKFDDEISVPKGINVVRTPLGRISFEANPGFTADPWTEPETVVIVKNPFRSTVEKYGTLLKGDLADRDAEVINLSIKDVSEQRADDILNAVLEVYTEKYINDKNKISAATSQFIEERLGRIEGELGVVDNDIMKFKEKTLVPDVIEAGKQSIHSSAEMDKEMLAATTELAMAEYIAEYVNDPNNKHKVIPINTIGLSVPLETQISNYNQVLLNRNNLAESSSTSNPLVKDFDAQLEGMRESIMRALNTHVAAMRQRVGKIEGAKGVIEGRIASSPGQAKYLRSVERQQEVKEQLYLFLLQKREENQLSQTFIADNTRVITPPNGPVAPVSPKKFLTVAIAFLFGLVLPGTIIYVQESYNTKIRSRKDLERMLTPFVGEIPFVGKKEGIIKRTLNHRKSKKHELEKLRFVVQGGGRDVINESFRIVRGNIDFMMRSKDTQVIMVTSFNAGSGKSFVTYNLCASFALKGQKVLLIDGDLRHGSTSQYVGMPSRGLTSYLTGNTKDWQSLVIDVPEVQNLSVLPIGHRPPNPAELLESPEMAELFKEVREHYDLIFIDCPPVDVVVDTQVLSPYVDRTIFVVRAGLLEKSQIPEIDEIYSSMRLKNVAILLNGTEQHFSRYGAEKGYYGSSRIGNEE